MIYTLEDLKAAYQKGTKMKFIFFWKNEKAENGKITESCLSQWWMCKFTADGIEYSCAEQYMMAQKAKMFGDERMFQLIMKAKHPKEMKAYGRAVQNFSIEKWDENCCQVVRDGNIAKFSQNKELWEFLKSTKNRILVEASPRDKIWGIGVEKSNPDAENPMKWKGKNLLGFTLMRVRDDLMQE